MLFHSSTESQENLLDAPPTYPSNTVTSLTSSPHPSTENMEPKNEEGSPSDENSTTHAITDATTTTTTENNNNNAIESSESAPVTLVEKDTEVAIVEPTEPLVDMKELFVKLSPLFKDIFVQILDFLDERELLKSGHINRQFREFIRSPEVDQRLWKKFYECRVVITAPELRLVMKDTIQLTRCRERVQIRIQTDKKERRAAKEREEKKKAMEQKQQEQTQQAQQTQAQPSTQVETSSSAQTSNSKPTKSKKDNKDGKNKKDCTVM